MTDHGHHAQMTDGHRSWTGRSVVSRATETVLSRYITAGTRQTRVSAMRIPGTRFVAGSTSSGASKRPPHLDHRWMERARLS